MQIPIVCSDSLNQVLAERARLLAREGVGPVPTLGRYAPSAGDALEQPYWQERESSDFLCRLHQTAVDAPVPAGGGKDLPLWHLLWAVPCLLAVAVLSVALLAPQGGTAPPFRDTAASVITLLPPVKLPKAGESAGAPTCPSCNQPMSARRNRETGELRYVCKSPTCPHAAASGENSGHRERD